MLPSQLNLPSAEQTQCCRRKEEGVAYSVFKSTSLRELRGICGNGVLESERVGRGQQSQGLGLALGACGHTRGPVHTRVPTLGVVLCCHCLEILFCFLCIKKIFFLF